MDVDVNGNCMHLTRGKAILQKEDWSTPYFQTESHGNQKGITSAKGSHGI